MVVSRGLYNSYRHLLALVIAVQLVTFFSSAPIAEAKAEPAAIFANSSVFPAEEFLNLTNAARATRGLPPLTLNDQLVVAANAKAADMVQKGYWDHFRPSDHKAPWDFIEEAGYNYKVAGENLARGFKTPEGITKAWLNSPSHRANIMSPKYTEIGFASVYAPGIDGKPILYTVQMFGSR